MKILIVFVNGSKSEFSGDEKTLSEEIGKLGGILRCSDSQINVRVMEGCFTEKTAIAKVKIIASSATFPPNIGKIIPDFKEKALAVFSKYDMMLDKRSLQVTVKSPPEFEEYVKCVGQERKKINTDRSDFLGNEEFDYEQKSKLYIPTEPLYSFDRVILSTDVIVKINEAIGILECEQKVFEEWGLYEIEPHPSTSLSFFGPSGTGKTMAAEAVAQKLGKKILKVSYADVESKYHGEGPKMIKAIFLAASNANAVLFFDEADSLLSKRLTNVSQGSEQAINSMRSQLLICLEEFKGTVIFATNLVINYDQAFLTRLISIEFKVPDIRTRNEIWNVHIKPPEDGKKHRLNIPLAEDIDTKYLAEQYDFVGREIRNAVVSACVAAAMEKKDIVRQSDFIAACDKIQQEKASLMMAKESTKSPNIEKDVIKEAILSKMKEKKDDKEKSSNTGE